MTTLAMPAISVGHQKYPAREATATILEAINEFVSEQQKISIQQIHLVDISDSVVNHFYESAIRTFGRSVVSVMASHNAYSGMGTYGILIL
jgi:O-acetyl-ADP-ribose deacetylase (regulator of RNase III)